MNFIQWGRSAGFFCISAVLLSASPTFAQSEAKTLKFSGFDWKVRGAGKGGPGPNQWDAQNVWLDSQGYLHLKIRKVGAEWRCAELSTTTRQGFGMYSFALIGRPDTFDSNIVLGLFTYPTPDVGTDGTNEIDIEFAHWGNPKWNIGNYTVYPASGPAPENKSHTFPFTLNGDTSLHRFRWVSDRIVYDSYQGHIVRPEQRIATWTYAPMDSRLIPQKPVPLHLNLWLFQGKPPTDGKEVEVVIKSVTYTP